MNGILRRGVSMAVVIFSAGCLRPAAAEVDSASTLSSADEALAKGDFAGAFEQYEAIAEAEGTSGAAARAMLGAGRAAFAQADYEAAARWFDYASLAPGVTPADEAIALAGKAAAWLEPARETLEENAVAMARDDLDAALARDAACVPALVWRGYLRTLSATSFEEETAALEDLKTAHGLGEDGWLLYLARGCVAIGHNDPTERDNAFAAARDRIDAELKNRPRHLHAWLKSIELAERTGDVDRLIADHTAILERWTDRLASLAGRAHARVLKRDYPAAIADCTAALEKGEPRAIIHWWRGYARTWTGDLDGALDDLGEAIVLNPDLKGPLARRAWLQNARGEWSMAIDDATRALERWPDDPDALAERGYAHKELNQPDDAIRDFDRVLEANPKAANVLRYRAEARNLQGEYEKAREDASAAIELAPGDGYAWRARSVAHVGLKKYEAAAADATKTIELLPSHAPGYINRGVARLALKQHAEALGDMGRAIELDPTNPTWYRERAAVHEAMGRSDLARKDLASAAALEGPEKPTP